MGVIRACLRGAFCLLGLWSALAWAQPGERTHTVERKETAYSIAQRYGVDLNRLFELNRWAEGGIRKGDVLRIPGALPAASPDAPTVDPVAPVKVDSLPVMKAEEPAGMPFDTAFPEMPRRRPVPPHWPGDTVRVAVLLPFSAGQDSLGRQAERLRDIALDCASGIRLALDTGRWLGTHVEVRFLDSGLDTAGVMLSAPEDLAFDGGPVDIVVGPLRRPAWQTVRTWPGVSEAVHLVLTDLGAPLVVDAPGVLYPFSQEGSTMALLAEHVARHHAGERVMMLATGDIRNLEAEDAFREGWAQANVDSLTTFVEVEVTSRGLGSLRDSLSDVRRNVLVAPGGKASRSFAGVLQTEIQLGDTMDFRLYADGSWRGFEFLDPGLLDRVAMTVVDGTGSRADSLSGRMAEDSVHVERARRLSVLRGGPVGRYGWLAHDLFRNALLWTAGHGQDWPQRLAAGAPLMAPTRDEAGGLYRFDWTVPQGPGSGLVNGASRLLRLEGLKWIELHGHD